MAAHSRQHRPFFQAWRRSLRLNETISNFGCPFKSWVALGVNLGGGAALGKFQMIEMPSVFSVFKLHTGLSVFSFEKVEKTVVFFETLMYN